MRSGLQFSIHQQPGENFLRKEERRKRKRISVIYLYCFKGIDLCMECTYIRMWSCIWYGGMVWAAPGVLNISLSSERIWLVGFFLLSNGWMERWNRIFLHMYAHVHTYTHAIHIQFRVTERIENSNNGRMKPV